MKKAVGAGRLPDKSVASFSVTFFINQTEKRNAYSKSGMAENTRNKCAVSFMVTE